MTDRREPSSDAEQPRSASRRRFLTRAAVPVVPSPRTPTAGVVDPESYRQAVRAAAHALLLD